MRWFLPDIFTVWQHAIITSLCTSGHFWNNSVQHIFGAVLAFKNTSRLWQIWSLVSCAVALLTSAHRLDFAIGGTWRVGYWFFVQEMGTLGQGRIFQTDNNWWTGDWELVFQNELQYFTVPHPFHWNHRNSMTGLSSHPCLTFPMPFFPPYLPPPSFLPLPLSSFHPLPSFLTPAFLPPFLPPFFLPPPSFRPSLPPLPSFLTPSFLPPSLPLQFLPLLSSLSSFNIKL